MLTSRYYKDRVIGEYQELLARYNTLEKMIDNPEELEPKHLNRVLLIRQLNTMLRYLEVLEDRARIEDIDLKRTKPAL